MLTEGQIAKLYKAVGDNIRRKRAKKFSQTELAKLVGVGRTSITNLELGKQRIPIHQLFGIAQALDCSIDELVPSVDVIDGDREQDLSQIAVVGDLTPSARAVLRRYSTEGERNEP